MTSRLYGYARVSTVDQDATPQRNAIIKAGVRASDLYTDIASGTRADRPQLTKLLGILQSGDTLIIWKLDRLARSLKHLITLSEELKARGVHLRSLTDNLDTSTASGELLFHMLAALAQFEASLIRERSRIGLEAAWASGKKSGRRPVDKAKLAVARAQLLGGGTLQQAMVASGLGRTSIYRHLDVPFLRDRSYGTSPRLGTDLGTKPSATTRSNGVG